jgi:RHS repeat-associated protein
MVKQRSIIISCHCTFIKSLILLSAVVEFSSLAQEGDPFGGGGLVGGGGGDIYVPPKTYSYNYSEINNVQTDVTTLTTELMGDTIDLESGTLSFTQTDVSIPGNFNIPVQIQRTLSSPDNWYKETRDFNNWSLAVPHVRSTYVLNSGNNPMAGAIGGAPYWADNRACSGGLNDNPDFFKFIDSKPYELMHRDYWNGDTISIPGVGSTTIINNNGTKTNAENWKIHCKTTNSFEITTPDGTKYLFSKLKIREAIKPLHMGAAGGPSSNVGDAELPPFLDSTFGAIPRKAETKMRKIHAFMMVTLITDRHGNTVNYNYNSSSQLTSIVASDSRQINISYTQGAVSSVTTNGRTWTYQYQTSTASNEIKKLTKVIRPDQKEWSFDYTPTSLNFWTLDNIGEHTQINAAFPTICFGQASGKFIEITHPAGAIGEFNLKERCLGKAGVPEIETYNAYGQGGTLQGYEIQTSSLLFSINTKKLTLPDGTEYEWDYGYSENQGLFHGRTVYSIHQNLSAFGMPNTPVIPNPSLAKQFINATYIVNPDGSRIAHYFDRRYGPRNGNLIHSGIFTPTNTLLQRKDVTYTTGNPYGISKNWTASYPDVNSQTHPYLISRPPPYQNDRVFRTSFGDTANQLSAHTITTVYGDTGGSSFYSETIHARNSREAPTELSQSSNTASRYIKLAYTENTSLWILNQPTTLRVGTIVSDTKLMSQNTYYNAASSYPLMPYQEKWFGETRKTFSSYHSDGNPNRVELNAALASHPSSQRDVIFSNYKRGQAQSVSVPRRYNNSRMTLSKIIDNNGWVTSTTDFNGTTTDYGYWPMGDIKFVDYENDGALVWQDMWFSWSQDSEGSPVRTTIKCTLNSNQTGCGSTTLFTTTEYYDSFYRLQMLNTLGSGITRYQLFDYDYKNQNTFTSNMHNTSSISYGQSTVFDALGRAKSVSSSGLGSVYYAHLSGNRLKITDAESNVTKITFRAFSTPSFNQAMFIDAPENIDTFMDYDLFGNVTSIIQSGLGDAGQVVSVTEKRAYDGNNNLCMTVRPDVGATATQFNLFGEMQWQAQGVSNVSANNPACLSTAPSDAVSVTQDNLGEPWKLEFYDPSLDVTQTRDRNGNLVSLVAGLVSQTYVYNNQNLLEKETLVIPDHSGSIEFDYHYNGMMHETGITYLGNETVSYGPNAYGEPTKASRPGLNYARGALYHSNGQLKSFTYGNNAVHNTTQHSDSQLPDIMSDIRYGSRITHLNYAFDNNANVTSILDGVHSAYNISGMQYDGLDRVTSVNGGSGIGNSSMQYDSIGNITYFSSKNRTLDYNYDYTLNRLTSITSTGADAKNYSNFVHDPRGNIENNSHFAMTYNDANQMTTANGNSYLYDGHNRRVKINSDDFSAYNQAGKLLYRKDTSGVSTHYIYLGGKLIAKKKGPVITYVHTDQLGSVSAESNTSGATLSRMHYKAFGDNIETASDDVGYTGHKFDTDIGLSYMQARYYDPVIGRFYSNDPVGTLGHLVQGNVQGFNRYAYANNNPYKYTDPDGRIPVALAWFATPPGQAALVTAGKWVAGITGAAIGVGIANDVVKPMMNESSVPDVPDGLVGDQSDDRSGSNKSGKKHTSGSLTPENGGTGDYETDLETLTGGTRPAGEGDSAPSGSQVGENGIFGRPENSTGGASIDIPAKGDKPHETLHYD